MILTKKFPFIVCNRKGDEWRRWGVQCHTIKCNVMWRLVRNAFSRIIRLKENVISLHAVRRIFFFLIFRRFYYCNTLLSLSCPVWDKPVSAFIPVDRIVNRLISSSRRTNWVKMTFSPPNLPLKDRNTFSELHDDIDDILFRRGNNYTTRRIYAKNFNI